MSKISELSDGGALQSTDYLIAVRSGGNVKVRPNGTVTGTTGSFSGNVTFADNAKAIFGAGSDLQIYHDGTTNDSIITESGAGNLVLQGDSLRLTNTSGVRYLQGNSGAEVNLWHNGSKKLETTSTGIDVTGTVTADGLTVDTNTLHVDATNNRVGVGTTSPGAKLAVVGTTKIGEGLASNTSKLMVNTTSGTAAGIQLFQDSVESWIIQNPASSTALTFANSGSERMRIDSAGNVGIGTTSPSSYPVASDLVIDTGTNGGITIKSGTTNYGGLFFADGTTGNEQYRGFIQYNHNYVGSVDALQFGTAGAEAMRIDSSGNLLVGTQISPAAADATAVRYGIGVQAGSLSSAVALTAGTAADVIDLTDVIDGSQNGAGMWLVSIVRDNASYGTHFVGIFGANNTSIALYHTLVATGITVTVSGTTVRANPTSATDTYNTNAIPLSITG